MTRTPITKEKGEGQSVRHQVGLSQGAGIWEAEATIYMQMGKLQLRDRVGGRDMGEPDQLGYARESWEIRYCSINHK